jgi:hypothetical protein
MTARGTVLEVKELSPSTSRPQGRGRMAAMAGTHIELASGNRTYDVHLGPSRYLTEKKFSVKKGETVEVIGSLVKIEGNDALIAREITKGDEKLVLRDAKGTPLWSRSPSR